MLESKSQSQTIAMVIIGAGGHGVCVMDAARACGFRIRAFIDPACAGRQLCGLPVLGTEPEAWADEPLTYAVAIGDNARRTEIGAGILENRGDGALPPVIHPGSVVSSFSEIGAGSVILQGACVGPNSSLGRLVLLGSCSSVDHDSRLADGASLGPGAILGGNVRVGERSAICIGAVVRHGMSIGMDTVLGANSYLDRELGDGVVAYGSPASVRRQRRRGDRYL